MSEFSSQWLTRESFARAQEGCERVAFRSPASIQPHGMLLGLDDELRIVQLSDNCPQWLGRPLESLLGQAVAGLFGDRQVAALVDLAGRAPDQTRCALLRLWVDGEARCFEASIHRSEGLWLLELEAPAEPPLDDLQTQQNVLEIGERLRRSSTVQAMSEALVGALRELTGFDLVLVFRFDEEGHGEVIAEDRADHMPTYLHHRFPATDVPRQVRRHTLSQPLRLVPDHDAEPVALVPAHHPLSGGEQDLSGCVLRSIHPWCNDFYRNLGVRAKLVIALARDDRVWGYVACHHSRVRHVPASLRLVCLSLSRLFSALLSSKLLQVQMAEERHLLGLLDQLLNRVDSADCWQEGLLAEPDKLLKLTDAGGAALYTGGDCRVLGHVPERQDIDALVAWLRDNGQPLYVSHRLAEDYPRGETLLASAAGLLAITLAEDRSDWLLWFRPEFRRTVLWAGTPEHGLRRDGEQLALASRFSFEQWQEQVRGSARRFRAVELEAAVRLRSALYKHFLQLAEQRLKQALDAALVANRAKSTFLATMSHELRTPLNSIIGFSGILRDGLAGPLNDEQTRQLTMVHDSARHLLSLINEILDLSKIEAGRYEVESAWFCLGELIEQLRNLILPQAQAKGLALSVDCAQPVAQIYSDAGKLRQLLLNLLGNAVKFTDRGSVALSCRFWEQGVMITVSDTGIGMDAQSLEQIFEPFFQVDAGDQRRFQGTGLGLAISNRLAQLLGGEIRVRSQPGQGSVFSVWLPDVPIRAATDG